MGTVNEKLQYLKETKEAIRTALVEKGADVPDTATFRSYAETISGLSGGLAGMADYFVEITFGAIGISGIVEEYYQLDVDNT